MALEYFYIMRLKLFALNTSELLIAKGTHSSAIKSGNVQRLVVTGKVMRHDCSKSSCNDTEKPLCQNPSDKRGYFIFAQMRDH